MTRVTKDQACTPSAKDAKREESAWDRVKFALGLDYMHSGEDAEEVVGEITKALTSIRAQLGCHDAEGETLPSMVECVRQLVEARMGHPSPDADATRVTFDWIRWAGAEMDRMREALRHVAGMPKSILTAGYVRVAEEALVGGPIPPTPKACTSEGLPDRQGKPLPPDGDPDGTRVEPSAGRALAIAWMAEVCSGDEPSDGGASPRIEGPCEKCAAALTALIGKVQAEARDAALEEAAAICERWRDEHRGGSIKTGGPWGEYPETILATKIRALRTGTPLPEEKK